MKKSSRDFRKNRRKKWQCLNYQITHAALSAVMGMFDLDLINGDTSLSKQEKMFKIVKSVINTASNVAKSFNPLYNSPTLSRVQSELEELKSKTLV